MKKNHKIILPLLSVFALQSLSAILHAQLTTFQKIYPVTTLNQSGQDVLPTPDGGYLIAGNTENTILNDLDIKVVKTDSLGKELWTKTYGGTRPDYPNCILQTNDGNYFVVGYSQSFGGGDQDVYLIKIDPSGNTLWTKTYGGYGNEDGKEIVATADGNYVIVGASNSQNFANNDMMLTKIDPAGNVIWMKYYGGPAYESARSVKLCLDGGFIMAGKTASTYSSVATMFLVKTDASGDTSWTRKYGGPNSYEGKSILANSDGTYTLCLDDSSGATDSDVRIMKIDGTGSVIWNNKYGGADKDISKMIQPTTDGGYIVASVSRSFGWINPDMWILKLDALGNTTWTRHYGGPGHEHCYGVRQTADGGYIAIGHTKSYTPNTEIMMVKLDAQGNVVPASVEEFAVNNFLGIYPNPSVDGIIHIDMGGDLSASTFKISNTLGQEVFSGTMDMLSQSSSKVIDMQGKVPGIYFVTIQSAKYLTTKKLVLK